LRRAEEVEEMSRKWERGKEWERGKNLMETSSSPTRLIPLSRPIRRLAGVLERGVSSTFSLCRRTAQTSPSSFRLLVGGPSESDIR